MPKATLPAEETATLRSVAKSRLETWRDWLPEGTPDPEELFTRDELLVEMRASGLEVSESDLRFWERVAVLPKPVRQGHKGATRAVYPWWYVPLVQRLRELQGEGERLESIRPLIRTRAQIAISDDTGSHPNQGTLTPGSLAEEIRRFAHAVESVTGVPQIRAELVLRSQDGAKRRYGWEFRD